MSLRDGLTPTMKPISPRRSAIVAVLDIGTSKIVCLIARLKPQSPQEVLRRRSHGVELLGLGHTESRGIKGGAVIDLAEAEAAVRHAVDLAERDASMQLESVIVSMSSGRIASELYAASIAVAGSPISQGDIATIDLRLSHRVTVRQSDEAAAARLDALKGKNPKKKGGAA